MPIQKLTAKYSTSVLLMDKGDLLNILSSALTEPYSTKTTSFVIGGLTLIAPRPKAYTD